MPGYLIRLWRRFQAYLAAERSAYDLECTLRRVEAVKRRNRVIQARMRIDSRLAQLIKPKGEIC